MILRNVRFQPTTRLERQSHLLRWTSVILFLFGIGLVCSEPALAEMMWTVSLRELASEADVIVVVRPMRRPKTESVPATRQSFRSRKPPSFPFIVKQVLRGSGLRPGQRIQVLNDGYHAWDGVRLNASPFTIRKDGTAQPEIKEALLFLTADRIDMNSDADYRMLFSGIRVLATDGRTLACLECMGAYCFVGSRKLPYTWLAEGDFRNMIKTLRSERSMLELRYRMYRGNCLRATPTDWLHTGKDVSPLLIAFSKDEIGSDWAAELVRPVSHTAH